MSGVCNEAELPGSVCVCMYIYIYINKRGDPLKGTLLNPTDGCLKCDLIERVYIPKTLRTCLVCFLLSAAP